MSNTNRTQFVILGILTFEPKSGYGLKKEIDSSVGFFWQESFGQLYPTLRKLEDSGLIEVLAHGSGGRGKKVYRITEEGRSVLREWLNEAPEPQPVRNELLLKLFLGWNVPPEVLIRHLEDARDHYQGLSRTYDRIARDMDCIPEPSPEDILGRLTLSFGIHRVRAGAAWAEEALERVRHLTL